MSTKPTEPYELPTLVFRQVKEKNNATGIRNVTDVQQKWLVQDGDVFEKAYIGEWPGFDGLTPVGFSRMEKVDGQQFLSEYYWVCKTKEEWRSLPETK